MTDSRRPEAPPNGVDGPRGLDLSREGGRDSGSGAASRASSAPPAQPSATGAGPSSALSAERYLAWLYSPSQVQPVLAALCQIEGEVAGSLRPGIDHHVAHARLQWWREECERTAHGRPVHPLTRELVAATSAGLAGSSSDDVHDGTRSVATGASIVGAPTASTAARSPASTAAHSPPSTAAHSAASTAARASLAGIAGFVDTAVWDLAGATFETRKELTAYCERWAIAMFETAGSAAIVAPVADEDMRPPSGAKVSSANVGAVGASRLRALGAAVREVEMLAGLAREAHAGRLRVPLDELEHAGVDTSSLANTPWPAPLATLLRQRHEALRATIAEGVAQLGRDEQPPLRGLLVWAALAWRLSWRAQHALPNVILPRRYHALSDGWHAWRAAHRAIAGKLRLH